MTRAPTAAEAADTGDMPEGSLEDETREIGETGAGDAVLPVALVEGAVATAETDLEAALAPPVLEALAQLEIERPATYMRLRAELLRANRAIRANILDRMILEARPKVLEVLDTGPLSGSESSTSPRESGEVLDAAGPLDGPSDGTPGQNEIADAVARRLRDRLAWDSGYGAWVEREAVDAPFRERDPLTVWSAIRREIERHRARFASAFVSGVETFLRADLVVPEWDTSRHLLPLANGVLDLNTRKLRPYTWADRFNWQLPHDFDPTATCPTIDRTIRRMVGGSGALDRFLRAYFLMVLLGRSDVHCFLTLIGEGNNGKSTLINLLRSLVGEENSVATDLARLESSPFETAALYGTRLAVISDSAQFHGEVPTLKALTGGDPIRLERKFQQQRRPFVYGGMLVVGTNQDLAAKDGSNGLRRRQRPLRIDYVVPEEERAPYRDKTKYPDGFDGVLRAEIPGLLNALLAMDVKAAADLVANPDEAMREQRLASELRTSSLLAWADERLVRCERGQESRIGDLRHEPGDGLYADYHALCKARGLEPKSVPKFSPELATALTSYGVETRSGKTPLKFAHMVRLRLRRPFGDESLPALLTHTDPSTGDRVEDFGGSVEDRNGASEDFEDFEDPGASWESGAAENYARASGR